MINLLYKSVILTQWLRRHVWFFDILYMVLLNNSAQWVTHPILQGKWARPLPGAAFGWQVIPILNSHCQRDWRMGKLHVAMKCGPHGRDRKTHPSSATPRFSAASALSSLHLVNYKNKLDTEKRVKITITKSSYPGKEQAIHSRMVILFSLLDNQFVL